MITVLNFCQKDRDQAFQLLQWMKEIGTCRNHELTLQSNIGSTVMGLHHELVALGTEMFEKCNFRTLDLEDERPWPFAANNAWRDYVYYSRVKAAQPFFWLEPDCMFIPGKGCPMCVIQKAYEVCGKPFMGGEVTKPEQRMSGVGVYPAYVTTYTKKLPSLNPAPQLKKHAVAWDQYLKPDIVSNCSFTPLIQHVWNVELGKPETIPTFPDQESLKLIKPETILFHRCKDGTLLARLREKTGQPFTPTAIEHTPAPSELDELKATIARLEAKLSDQSIIEQADALRRKAVEEYANVVSAALRSTPPPELLITKQAGSKIEQGKHRKKAKRHLSPEHKAKLKAAWEKRKAVAA